MTVRSAEVPRRQAEILRQIEALGREHLGISGPLEPSSRLVEDLELDSLRRLTLAVEIEDHFEICLEPEDEAAIETVADLVAAVARKLGNGASPGGEREEA